MTPSLSAAGRRSIVSAWHAADGSVPGIIEVVVEIPARQPQQVRVRRGRRRHPPRPGALVGGVLQLRLRLRRRHARRGRRPHGRDAPHRRADVPRLPRLGAAGGHARDARREGRATSRSCASRWRDPLYRPRRARWARSRPTGCSRSSTSSRPTRTSRTRRSSDRLGRRRPRRSRSCAPTGIAGSRERQASEPGTGRADGARGRRRSRSPGREVDHHQPGQGLLPRGRPHQARPRPLLPGRRRRRAARRGGRPMALKRFVNGAAGRLLLPEARARVAARLDRDRRARASRPAAPRTRSSCATRRSSPGSSTSAASTSTRTRCAPTTSTIPTSCASTSTRCPGVPWDQVREVALVAREALDDRRPGRLAQDVRARAASTSTCASSGAGRSRRCAARRWRSRATSSGARPTLATSKWWKEERHGVFLDYNQNAKDRTVASAYSVRPTPDARVSMPLRWDEVADVEPADFTLATVPALFAERGDAGAGIDDAVGSLEALLELSARHEAEGHGRRAVAAALPQAGGRAAARAALEAASARLGRTGRRDARKRQRWSAIAERPSPPRPDAAGARSRVIEIARAPRKEEALAGLERWKARHPDAAAHLEPADVLVDAMRGRSTTWTASGSTSSTCPRPSGLPQEPLDPDYDPWAGFEWPDRVRAAQRAPRRKGRRYGDARSRRKWRRPAEHREEHERATDQQREEPEPRELRPGARSRGCSTIPERDVVHRR